MRQKEWHIASIPNFTTYFLKYQIDKWQVRPVRDLSLPLLENTKGDTVIILKL